MRTGVIYHFTQRPNANRTNWVNERYDLDGCMTHGIPHDNPEEAPVEDTAKGGLTGAELMEALRDQVTGLLRANELGEESWYFVDLTGLNPEQRRTIINGCNEIRKELVKYGNQFQIRILRPNGRTYKEVKIRKRYKKVVLVFGTPSEPEDETLKRMYGRSVTKVLHADILFDTAAAHQDLEGYLNTMVEETPAWKKALDKFHGSDPERLGIQIVIDVRNGRFLSVMINNPASFDPEVEFVQAVYQEGQFIGYRRITHHASDKKLPAVH